MGSVDSSDAPIDLESIAADLDDGMLPGVASHSGASGPEPPPEGQVEVAGDEPDERGDDLLDPDRFDRYSRIFAFVSSILTFFQKVGGTMDLPGGMDWPDWMISIGNFLTKIMDWIISFLPSYPGIDPQVLAILAGVFPFLLFCLLWRYFSNSAPYPFGDLLRSSVRASSSGHL
jgi:hypothetical protein